MKVFVDTNVFIASITDEPGRGDVATELLNGNHDFCTSILNLMEIRSVLTKKKRVEQERVEEVLADIYGGVDIYAPEISDQVSACDILRALNGAASHAWGIPVSRRHQN
ncbi:type II toxin-antitoxin system VapC family toxin, partial [Halonotius pteroides]